MCGPIRWQWQWCCHPLYSPNLTRWEKNKSCTFFPTLFLSYFQERYTLPLPKKVKNPWLPYKRCYGKGLRSRTKRVDQGATARMGHTCNVVGNFLYVLGGYDANRNFTNSVFIFDTGSSFHNLSSKFSFLFDTACLTSMLNFCFPSFYIQLWHCCVSCKLLLCFAFLSNLWNSHGFTLINLCLDASFFCIPILSNFYFSLFSCKICGICMVWNWLIYIGMLFFKGFLFVKFLCHCCVSCFPFLSFFLFFVSIKFY